MTALEAVLPHAPMLLVLVPMLSAPVAMLFGNRNIAFGISFVASAVSFALAVYLLLSALNGSVISYLSLIHI